MKTFAYPLVIATFCGVGTAFAEEPTEIGTDQKVLKAYELYLRDQGVTLHDQQTSYGVDTEYTHDEQLGIETRALTSRLNLNYGLNNRIELDTSLPVTLGSNTHSESLEFDDSRGVEVGNLSVGANYTFSRSTTLSGRVEFPTGGSDAGVALGAMVHVDMDPVVLYGGGEVEQSFGHHDGTTLTGSTGLILSVNDSVAVGGGVQTSYSTKDTGGVASKEATMLTGKAVVSLHKNDTFETRVSFGLNDSAPDVVIGFGRTRSMY